MCLTVSISAFKFDFSQSQQALRLTHIPPLGLLTVGNSDREQRCAGIILKHQQHWSHTGSIPQEVCTIIQACHTKTLLMRLLLDFFSVKSFYGESSLSDQSCTCLRVGSVSSQWLVEWPNPVWLSLHNPNDAGETPSLCPYVFLLKLSAKKALLHVRFPSFTNLKSFLAHFPLTREAKWGGICVPECEVGDGGGGHVFTHHFLNHPTFLISLPPSTFNRLSIPLTPAPGSGGQRSVGILGIACWFPMEWHKLLFGLAVCWIKKKKNSTEKRSLPIGSTMCFYRRLSEQLSGIIAIVQFL